jgi:hypothetical protein
MARQNSKITKQERWPSKPLNYLPVLNIWNRQQKMMEDQQKTHSISDLSSKFTKLDLSKRLSKKQPPIREEDITMSTAVVEEADEETGVETKEATLFWQRKRCLPLP